MQNREHLYTQKYVLDLNIMRDESKKLQLCNNQYDVAIKRIWKTETKI